MSGVPESIHPDGWHPGLKFGIKTLNIKTVTRAAIATEVLPVCLSHNLRSGNTLHRHRSQIDPLRTHLNTVLLGSGDPAIASECASNILDELGITVRRADSIMAIEMVFQPPDGWDRPEFFHACLLWVRTRYQYIVSAVVHRDQKRPHMHVLVLPILDGKLAGAAMTSHANRSQAQRADFLAFMLETLGLRPTEKRQRQSITGTFFSAGKGPQTRAEAARRDAEERTDGSGIHRRLPLQVHHPADSFSSTSILRRDPLDTAVVTTDTPTAGAGTPHGAARTGSASTHSHATGPAMRSTSWVASAGATRFDVLGRSHIEGPMRRPTSPYPCWPLTSISSTMFGQPIQHGRRRSFCERSQSPLQRECDENLQAPPPARAEASHAAQRLGVLVRVDRLECGSSWVTAVGQDITVARPQ